MLDLQNPPLWLALVIFALAAALVWIAGTRLAGYADRISDLKGIGKAFIGFLLLGGITSLPEVAVSGSASLRGNAPIAVNNLVGGFAMQVAVLGLADAVKGKGSLTLTVSKPGILLQAVLCVVLLSVLAAGIAVGDTEILGLGVGAWSVAMLVVYLISLWLVQGYEDDFEWKPREDEAARKERSRSQDHPGTHVTERKDLTLGQTIVRTCISAAVILVAGYFLVRSGESIAAKTGLGQSFVGAVLIAIATSLPEISTTFSAIRIGEHEMAFSNIFGTNLLTVALVFLVDVLYPGGPVLNEVSRFSLMTVLLGISVTSIYLVGLLVRPRTAVLRMGLDSLVVVLVYLGGVCLLFRIR